MSTNVVLVATHKRRNESGEIEYLKFAQQSPNGPYEAELPVVLTLGEVADRINSGEHIDSLNRESGYAVSGGWFVIKDGEVVIEQGDLVRSLDLLPDF